MKKNGGLLKSLSVCLVVAVLMVGAGFFLLSGDNQATQTGGKVEAAWDGQSAEEKKVVEEIKEEDKDVEANKQSEEPGLAAQEECEEEVVADEEEVNQEEVSQEVVKKDDNNKADNSYANDSSESKDDTTNEKEEPKDNPEPEIAQNNNTVKDEVKPVETVTEEPAAAPAPVEEPKEEVKVEPKPEVQSVSVTAPVKYTWGTAGSYTFRMEVSVTNNGSSPSSNVTVAVPLLENSSPYQETTLKSVNYNIVSTSGRVSTFNLGDLAPGETKTIRADFDIRVRPVAISSTNETVEKARQAYEMYAGSGNCRTLARAFINKCHEMGINAREVIGFARPQRGAMTSGSLAGCRHSWAEFEVPGLGWVPVDLTFQYFGELPQTSHVVESYSDQSISVNFSGGSLSATWSNLIL